MQSVITARPVDIAGPRRVQLFPSLTDTELLRVAEEGHERAVEPGATIVRQWEYMTDFYVVLEGTADTRAGDRHRSDMGPGDHSGELAALKWDASFGYPRMASVVATSPMQLLVLPATGFRALMHDIPAFDGRIRRTVRERLPCL